MRVCGKGPWPPREGDLPLHEFAVRRADEQHASTGNRNELPVSGSHQLANAVVLVCRCPDTPRVPAGIPLPQVDLAIESAADESILFSACTDAGDASRVADLDVLSTGTVERLRNQPMPGAVRGGESGTRRKRRAAADDDTRVSQVIMPAIRA